MIEIPTVDVVLDDLIELRTGDQVPADGTMLSTVGLEIDESNLTGEADAIAEERRRRGAVRHHGGRRQRAVPAPPPSVPTPT